MAAALREARRECRFRLHAQRILAIRPGGHTHPELLLRLAREHEVLITVEEGSTGGFAAQVLQALAEHGVLDRGLKVRAMVLPDHFIDQDSPMAMYAKAGLDANAIAAKGFETLGSNARQVWRN